MTETRKRGAKKAIARPMAAADGDVVTWAYGVLSGRVQAATLARLPRLPDAAEPHAIPLTRQLAIIAAHVPRPPFETGTLEARLHDIEWVSQHASAHHAVLEALGKRGTMLPLRIFTVFDSDERAKAAIGRREQRLQLLAAKVAGRSEWVLRIHRPTTTAPMSTPRVTSGTAFLRARADVQRTRVQQARMIEAGVTALIADLAALADDSVERAVEPGTSALAEAAFLVERRQLAAFKRALTKASVDIRREGCRLALTGPWPVYSFVDMESRRG